MNEIIERIKDKGSTIPGLLFTITGLIAIFKEYAVQLIDFVSGLGYTWNPNPTTIALVLIIVLGLKMIFLDGKKDATRVILKDEVK